jgi:hypothetical protein
MSIETTYIENPLRVLDLFYLANESKPSVYKLDYKKFYNEAINTNV